MKLFIGNLNSKMRAHDLREEFSRFGEIVVARIILDKETKQSKEFGFVEFVNENDAKNAINFFNGQEVWEKSIFVDYAIEIKDRNIEYYDTFLNSNENSFFDSELKKFLDVDVLIKINDDISFLIRKLVNNNIDIFKISPRKFEELIAELLTRDGWKCELTSISRDGGKDIIATQYIGNIPFMMYVECKLFNPAHKVSISIIKNLHSTVLHDQVNKGIIATTSLFTQPAKDYINDDKWRLEGKDINDIYNWINLYKFKK
jgi:restriction system protein